MNDTPLGFASGQGGSAPALGGFASKIGAAPAAAPLVTPTGKIVNVVAPDGALYGLDEAHVPGALADGYKLESAEAAGIRRYVAENSGLSGTARVAIANLADEATFGVSGAIGRKILQSSADPYALAKWEALRADHDVANAVGGAVGFGTSLLYGGEFFGLASKAGGGVARKVLGHAATDAIEHAAGRGVAAELAYRSAALAEPEAAKAGAGIARRILASSADMGTQGLVLSSPKALTEAMLGDPERAAETWLYGAAGGAALGAVGGLAGGITGKIKQKLFGAARAEELSAVSAELAKAEQEAVAAEAAHVGSGAVDVPQTVMAVRDRVIGLRAKAEAVRETLAGHHARLPEYIEAAAQYATNKPGVGLRQIAKDFAEEQAIKSIAPYKKYADKLAEMPGGEKAAGRLLLERKLLPETNEAVEEYAGRLAEHTSKVGAKIGEAVDHLSTVGQIIPAKNIARNLRVAVLEPLEKKVGYRAQASRVRSYVEDFEAKHGLARLEDETKKQWQARIRDVKVSVGELHEQRVDLDRLIYGEDSALTGDKIDKELRAIRGVYQMEMENGINKASNVLKMEPGELARIQTLNREYGAFKVITQAVEKNIGRTLANRSASWSDYIAGAAGSAAGALLGPLGSVAGGAVAGYVNNQLRRNANSWLAELADHYAKTGQIPNVIERAYRHVGDKLAPGKWGTAVDDAAAAGAGMRNEAVAAFGKAAGTDRIVGAVDNVTAAVDRSTAATTRVEQSLVALEQSFKSQGEKLSMIPKALEAMALGKRWDRIAETAGSVKNAARVGTINILTTMLGANEQDLNTSQDVMTFADKIASLASNPAQMQQHVEAAIAPLTSDAPEVASAAAVKMPQIIGYLAGAAPKAPTVQSPFEPKTPWTPSGADIAAFRTKVKTALNPHIAIDALANGTLTAAHIEALQAVAPKIYSEMQRKIMEYGGSGKAKPLAYAQRLKLSMLTGVPLDRSIAQIAGYQEVFAAKPEPAQGHAMKIKTPEIGDVARLGNS